MFSSLTAIYSQPIGVFASKGPTKGVCLAQLTIELIKRLEQHSARVHRIVCDSATANRKMWTEYNVSGTLSNPVNKIIHKTDEKRHIFYFPDAPHLMKCIRNKLCNSSHHILF